MSTRFAGSQSLDERRRRRLASHAEQEADTTASIENAPPSDDRIVEEQTASENSNVSHFPLRKLISPKAWKLWGIGLMGFLTGAALLRAGQFAAEAGSGTSDEFVRLFDPANGGTFRVYGSVMCLLSGQLAMLIWWVRSRSPLDFGGLYRVWMKIAAGCVVASLFLLTDFHILMMDVIRRRTDITLSSQLELCWLIPVTLSVAFLLRMMHREMRENRISLILLWIAAAGGLISSLQTVGYTFSGSEGNTQLVRAGTALFTQLGLMMSLLFHTRHVIYVSLDPPKKKSVPLRSPFQFRLPSLHLPQLRFPRLQMPTFLRRTEKESTKAAIQKHVDEPSVNEIAPAQQPPKKRKSQKVLDDPPCSANDAPASREENRASQIEELTQNMRVDEPIDNELLKGLSKKQRRKLRKQHRQLQRAESSQSPDIDDEN